MEKHIWMFLGVYNLALAISVAFLGLSFGKWSQVFLLLVVAFFTFSMGIGAYLNENENE